MDDIKNKLRRKNKVDDNKKILKFESSERFEELNPKNTLEKVGFKEGMILCDIGAGTGIFSFPATEISRNEIFALDISEDMIELLTSRVREKNIENLNIKKVVSEKLPLEDNICDMAIMVTVLHEIENKAKMLNEISRVLKRNGKLMIIEFHKRKTPMGPPVEHRLSEEEVKSLCNKNDLRTIDKFSLGENFYGIVFQY